ncbi:Hypothetical predicted protein [Xyrichtys novacula]|uniref:Uncharacterized protein n=1 Tax=Xyrichtys novacula TaxID=13765 RepID=A0AAV1ENE9_XYRNO|nr:Hypothetical predicted protein [Xyrichtys novacula]
MAAGDGRQSAACGQAGVKDPAEVLQTAETPEEVHPASDRDVSTQTECQSQQQREEGDPEKHSRADWSLDFPSKSSLINGRHTLQRQKPEGPDGGVLVPSTSVYLQMVQ